MRIRSVITSLIAAASLGGLMTALGATPAIATAPHALAADQGQASPAGKRAFAEMSGCVASTNTLLAMIVVDESGSLRSTDPAAQRVPAINSAVDALQELKASAPGQLKVQVAMSTFAQSYHPLVGWGELGKAHADKLRSTAAAELPKRNTGALTDYRQALQGAQRQLDSRASTLKSPSACKVMLWFTDGALDVGPDTAAAADQLCRPNGIVDSVRRDHIAVVALALFTPGGQVTDAQRDQLRAVAEGTGATTRCGRTPISSDASSGVYLSADDPASLRRLFAGATALISGAMAGPTVSCPGPRCPNGRFTFSMDPGVGGFRVIADVGAHGTPPTLLTPDGTRLLLPTAGSQTFSIPGGRLEMFARDGLVTATMQHDSLPTAPRKWQVDVGRNIGSVDLYWYWDATLGLAPLKLTAGESGTVRGTITGPDGSSVDPRLYRQLGVRVAVGADTVPATVHQDGSFDANVTLPARSGRTEVAVGVTATARTRGSAVTLGPLTTSTTAPVTLPPAFPSLTPTKLRLAALQGLGSRTAEIVLTGSKLGPTRVCFQGSTVTSPAGALVHAAPQAARCVSLSAGQHSRLRVDLAPAAAADGVASGDLTFSLTGVGGSGTIEASVPTEFDMIRPVHESTRWLLVVLLVGFALLIPVLLLLVAEWILGRFIITPTHQVAVVPVTLTPSGPERLGSDTQDLVASKDLRNLSLSRVKRVRHFPVPATSAVLRIGNRLNILRGSRGLASVPQGNLVASGTAPYSRGAGREAEVGLGRADLWFVITEPQTVQSSETPQARLVVLFPADDTPLSERVDDIHRAHWDSILAALSGHAATADTKPSSSPIPVAMATSPQLDLGARPDWADQSDAPESDPTDLPVWLPETGAGSAPQPSATKAKRQAPPRDEGPPNTTLDSLPPIDFL